MKTLLALVLVIGVALPAHAHTPAEQDAWKRDWVTRVATTGLSPRLLGEYLDFQLRHVPPPPPPRSATSTYRGMGSGVERWRGLVAAHFPGDVDRALCIMSYESGGNPNARNPRSGAAGLFQVMPFWWEHYGGDRYDPETNVRVARLVWDQQGWGGWSPYNRGLCR